MTDNAIALFKGANLPALNLDTFKKALVTTQQVAAVTGGTPFLKMLKQDGTWVYGVNETDVQEGSLWAINPLSLKIGFVCWNPKGGKPLGEQMRSIFETPLMQSDLPNLGGNWDENVGLELKCINGEDKDTDVQYTANSYGGRKAFTALVSSLQKQLDNDPTKIVPVVNLTNDSYKSPQYGLIFNPIFEIVNWMTMAGPQPTAGEPAAEPVKETVQTPAAKPARRTAVVTEVAQSVVEGTSQVELDTEAAAAARVAAAVIAAGKERIAAEAATASGDANAAAGAATAPVQRRRRRAAAV